MTTSPQHASEQIDTQPLVTPMPPDDARTPRRRRVPMRRVARLGAYVVLALAALAAVVISFTGMPQRGDAQVQLLTSTVRTGTARTEVSGSGDVAPALTTDLTFGAGSSAAASASGAGASAGQGGSTATTKVASVRVKAGEHVTRGEVLATLDTASLSLSVDAAQQSYEAAVDARDNPSTTTSNGSTSQDQSDAALDLAVTEAQVNLSTAKDNLAAATIVAPHAGIVDAVNVTAGSAPPSGSAAITLRGSSMAVSIDVAEDDITSVKVGQKATVHLVALDTDVTGTVTAIDAEDASSSASASSSAAPSPFSSSSNSAVTFPVTVALARVPRGLRAGMSATVSVVTGEHAHTLLVPLTAVVGAAANASVRIPKGAHAFTTKSVQVGLMTSKTAEIISGLREGDTVVTGIVRPKSSSDATSTSSSGLSGITGGNRAGGFGAGGFGGGPPGGFAGGGFSGGARRG